MFNHTRCLRILISCYTPTTKCLLHLMITSTLYVLYPFSGRESDTWDKLTCPTEPWPGSKWYSCASHSQDYLTLEPALLIVFLCYVQEKQLCHMWTAELRSGSTLDVSGLTCSSVSTWTCLARSAQHCGSTDFSHCLCSVADTLIYGGRKRTCVSFWLHAVRMKINCHCV